MQWCGTNAVFDYAARQFSLDPGRADPTTDQGSGFEWLLTANTVGRCVYPPASGGPVQRILPPVVLRRRQR